MGKNYTYCTVQALSGQFNEPEEGKSPSIEVRLKVTACKDSSRIGEEFTEFMSLHENAAKYSLASLRALGWTCNDVTELEGLGTIQAQGGIYTDTYNGKTRDKCSVFSPKAKVTGAAKKSFAAKFKAAAASAAKVDVTDANKALAADDLPQQQRTQFADEDLSGEVPF